jgi:hypothetical protein
MTDSDEGARDRQLASELEVLRQERADILHGSAVENSVEMAKIHDILRRKLQIAEDSRQYQLANLGLHLELEKKRAWDEYMAGKARLREQVVLSHIERRKRFDALKLGGTSGVGTIPLVRRDYMTWPNGTHWSPRHFADFIYSSMTLPFCLIFASDATYYGAEFNSSQTSKKTASTRSQSG